MQLSSNPQIDTNPFLIFKATDERNTLFRSILTNSSTLSPSCKERVLATLLQNQELLDDLSTKESRNLLALAQGIRATPWPIAESDDEVNEADLQAALEASKKADNVVPFSSSGTVSLPVSFSPSLVSSLPSAVSVAVSHEESVPSNLPSVSVDFADVRARVLSTQSILTSLKSTVVRMEKVLLDYKKLLQSFEAVVLISILDDFWSIPWIVVDINGVKHWGDWKIGGNTCHWKEVLVLITGKTLAKFVAKVLGSLKPCLLDVDTFKKPIHRALNAQTDSLSSLILDTVSIPNEGGREIPFKVHSTFLLEMGQKNCFVIPMSFDLLASEHGVTLALPLFLLGSAGVVRCHNKTFVSLLLAPILVVHCCGWHMARAKSLDSAVSEQLLSELFSRQVVSIWIVYVDDLMELLTAMILGSMIRMQLYSHKNWIKAIGVKGDLRGNHFHWREVAAAARRIVMAPVGCAKELSGSRLRFGTYSTLSIKWGRMLRVAGNIRLENGSGKSRVAMLSGYRGVH
nr:uncharacterized protein LOC109181161 [Ipomoea batatas]